MEQCVKNYCGNTFLKNQEALALKFFNQLQKKSENKNKNYTLKLKKNAIKELKKSMKKNRKANIATCKKGYCNPECKGTIFEKGKSAPKEMFDEDIFEKGPAKNILKEFAINQRKGIFGKKTDVLKDSFYEKLSPETVKKLKKEGALSGCSLMAF